MSSPYLAKYQLNLSLLKSNSLHEHKLNTTQLTEEFTWAHNVTMPVIG